MESTGSDTAVSPEALLAAIVTSTDDAVLTVDLSGTIQTCNPAAEGLYGYTTEEMVGGSISVLVPDVQDWRASLELLIAGQRVGHRESERRCRDGSTVAVGETLSLIHDDRGLPTAVVSIAHDITERVSMERALAEATRELEVKNRRLERSNADLEQFAYIASHDLSEPLRGISGMVGLLARRYRGRLDDDADEFIDYAVEGCDRMRAMIEDLLAFSRAGRVEMRPVEVDLGEVLAEALRGLRQQIDDTGAAITVGPLPSLRADPRQLAQVLQNLLSNALKFAPADTPPSVEVTASTEPGGWRISVADRGIGIEPQYQERIFRMFQRLHTRDAYPGTGIGLALTERIVDRHGGTIGVTDTPGGGATFWFTLPDDPEDHL